jgi:gas vesicle protein
MMKVLKVFTAGVIIGLLFAPQKGTKTRKRISKIFKTYKDDAKEFAEDIADKVESNVKTAKKAIKKI